jgi:hypothetical protein
MEILMIIIGVLAVISMIAFLVHLFIKAINKDQQEQDERILQLEKRIESYNKKTNDRISMEIGQRQLLEELTNDEIANIHKQMIKLNKKKKSDKE